MSDPRTPAGRALAAVGRLRDTVRELAAVDPAELPAVIRLQAVEELAQVDAMLAAQSAQILSAVHTNGDSIDERGRTTRGFLVEEVMVGDGEASRQMRLARHLPNAPVVAAALASGEIGVEHALTITKVLPHLDDEELRGVVERVLVDLATWQPPAVVARAVDDVIARYASDTAEEQARRAYERKYAERGVTLSDTIGGTKSLSGTLMPEAGAQLDRTLAALSQKAGPDDTRTPAQRRHDALAEMARLAADHLDLPTVNGERPHVNVTMSLTDLLDRLTGVDGEDSFLPAGNLADGTALPAATVRRLACDSNIIPAVLGGSSEILDLGRVTRTWTPAQRRAAAIRDGYRCVFPNCTRPPRELHHIKWWVRDHGPSDLVNSSWLCSFHHWLVHEGRWTAHRDGHTGDVIFASPSGTTRRSTRHTSAAPSAPARPDQGPELATV